MKGPKGLASPKGRGTLIARPSVSNGIAPYIPYTPYFKGPKRQRDSESKGLESREKDRMDGKDRCYI